MKRLAIITTHPIQYNAPLFRLLAERRNIEIKVFYTWGEESSKAKYDPGFGKTISWDIPLLEGYGFEFVNNTSSGPGSHHFRGIINPTLISQLKSWGADVLLVYGWSFVSHLKIIRHFHGRIPVLFRGDSTLLNQQSILKRVIRNFFLRWVYSHIDHALYVGSNNKAYFVAVGLKESQLHFAPHCIDNQRFGHLSTDQIESVREGRAELGLNNNDILFLYAGKLDGNKNVKLLASAFLEVSKPGCHLLIAGNGAEEGNLKAEFGKNPSIHFLPFQNQARMPILYGMSDVFVLPSISETWGLGINEAMAAGKAVIASSGTGAAIDLIEEGVNGFTFENNNVKSLSEKLDIMMNDPVLVNKMGKHSFRIIQDWSFHRNCEVIENLVI